MWSCNFFSSLLRAVTWSATCCSRLCKEIPRRPCTVDQSSALFSVVWLGLPCALPGREDLLGFMALDLVLSPGRCPVDPTSLAPLVV